MTFGVNVLAKFEKYEPELPKLFLIRGYLAGSVEPVTLHLGILSSSPMLDIEINLKKLLKLFLILSYSLCSAK